MPKRCLGNHRRLTGLEVTLISYVFFVLRLRVWEQHWKNSSLLASAATRVRTGELALILKTREVGLGSGWRSGDAALKDEPGFYKRFPGGVLLKFLWFAILDDLYHKKQKQQKTKKKILNLFSITLACQAFLGIKPVKHQWVLICVNCQNWLTLVSLRRYPESANHHLASLSIDVLSYLLHPNLPFYLFIF